ncbi:MAG: hypothetical protein C0410_02880 [Anaerolinea sp.]|nr:hypothetical protein [Anaerolinea sp.]
MQNSKLHVLLTFVGILSLVMISSASVPKRERTLPLQEKVSSKSIAKSIINQETSPCLALLFEAAQKGGVPGTLVATNDYGLGGCNINYDLIDENYVFLERTELFLSNSGDFDDEPCGVSIQDGSCKQTTFHGYPAAYFTYTGVDIGYTLAWNMPTRNDHYRLGVYVGFSGKTPEQYAEALWSVAEDRLPLTEGDFIQTESPTENNPEIVVVPNGDTAPTDNSPEIVVVPYGSDSEETTVATGSFDETWASPQAKAVRSPLIPITGGLIGAGLAWLLAQGASQAANTAVPMAATVYAPPQTIPPVITQTPPELVSEPPMLVTEPPPVQTETPPVNPYELALNLVKDPVGAAGTLTGIYEKFLTNPESLKTANIIKEAVKKLDQTPGVEATTEYVADVAKLKAAEKIGKLGKNLGVAGKGLDLVEAGMKAQKICAERGYHGFDAVMRTYAEVGKKGVVWLLTENPVVGVADAVVGGATTIIFGAANKVDLGVVVDKTDYAWDNVTRHASNKWNRSFETAANDAQIDDVRTLTQRIAQQVREGKLTKQEGAQRLHKVLDKINQESPLL